MREGTFDVTTGKPRADRAMAAMLPFVIRWGFPVNPVEEIVYAVLLHADSDASLEEIARSDDARTQR